MADPTDLTDTIATEAASPVSSSGDGQTATGRSIADLIAADRYLAAKAAARRKRRGLIFNKLLPPGPGGEFPTGGGTTGFGG